MKKILITLLTFLLMCSHAYAGNVAVTELPILYSADTGDTLMVIDSDEVSDTQNKQLTIDLLYSGITKTGTVATGTWNATPIELAYGGTNTALVDPGADRILFWDDSADTITFLTANTNISISTTNLNVDDAFLVNDADDTTTSSLYAEIVQYGSLWNGSQMLVTADATYDEIENKLNNDEDDTTTGKLYTADMVYSGEWNGLTSLPTMNAVYDQVETKLDNDADDTTTSSLFAEIIQYGSLWDGSQLLVTADATYDEMENKLNNDEDDTTTGKLYTADMVYSGEWNGLTSVPTMNAVYDKIETISAASGGANYWIRSNTNKLIPRDLTDTGVEIGDIDSSDSILIKATDTGGEIVIEGGGDITLNAITKVKNGTTSSGILGIYEDSDDGGDSTAIRVPDLNPSLEWILPASNGTAGQVLEIASVNANSITLEWDDDGGAAGGGANYWIRNVNKLIPRDLTDSGVEIGDVDSSDSILIKVVDTGAEISVEGGGDITMQDPVMFDNGTTGAGLIGIYEDEDDGGDSTAITNGNLTDSFQWVLPLSAGTAGQVLEIAAVDGNNLHLEWDTDGGGASEVNIELHPQTAKLPASHTGGTVSNSPAAIDAGDYFWRILYDKDTAETATWQGVMDDDYGGGTLYADIYWSMNEDLAPIVWTVNVDAITPGDANDFSDTPSWGGDNDVTDTSSDDAVILRGLVKATVTLTNDDNIAAGDLYNIAVRRSVDDATDTGEADAELRQVIIRE